MGNVFLLVMTVVAVDVSFCLFAVRGFQVTAKHLCSSRNVFLLCEIFGACMAWLLIFAF